MLSKYFVACIYLWTALNRTLLFQYSNYHCQKNQINTQGLKNFNCIIENLPFDCEFSTMKEVVDGVPYHATQNLIKDYHEYDFKKCHLFLSHACNTDILYLCPMVK